MGLIVESGGGVRAPARVPTVAPGQQQPVSRNESDAANGQRQLQRQLEALMERMREAQRRAEEAHKRAVEMQNRAEQTRRSADAAAVRAERTKAQADEAAARRSEQSAKLTDARFKKESANVNLQDQEVALLKAQVALKKEQKESADGAASAATDQKAKDAHGSRDEAAQTHELSRLYADYQEKESKAQDAQAKVAVLTPVWRRTDSGSEHQPLTPAQASAAALRAEAGAAQYAFTSAVGADAQTDFYGSPPPAVGGASTAVTAQPITADPLHSPLLQMLQVPARPDKSPGGALWAPQLPSASSTAPAAPNSLFAERQPVGATQVPKTLAAIADGKSIDQISSERGVGRWKVIAEANAAGISIESAQPSQDVQTTTVKRGDASLTYWHDTAHETVTVKGAFADPDAPGGRKAIEATRDADGRFTRTIQDPKTGNTVTHLFDADAGTRTERVARPDGSRTETTADLTGAPVLRPVGDREGYLDVAKAAGLTPEQLRALNPDVDYGVALKPGQMLVVAGVPTTVRNVNQDGTSLERTTLSDGSLQVEATTASGRRITLMGGSDPARAAGEAVRKALFDDRKTVAQTAAGLGLTPDQVLAALPPGTVEVTAPTSDNGDVETRTLFDPTTNRTVIETHDWQHDAHGRREIDEQTTFRVRQFDPESGKFVSAEVAGGVGYAQQRADEKLAMVGDYDRRFSDLGETMRMHRRMGEPVTGLQAERMRLVAQRDTARGEAGIEQAQASSMLSKRQQVVVDAMVANSYRRLSVARPGSAENTAATQKLSGDLVLADKVDRLVPAADNDVAFLKAELDQQHKHDARVQADAHLQTEFEKWKPTWRWQGYDEKQIKELEAQGQRPPGPIYNNAEAENEAAWRDFKTGQEFQDASHGLSLTNGEVPRRDAWLLRNRASDAEVQANINLNGALIDKQAGDANAIEADIAELAREKEAWVKSHPDDFSETFPGQGELNQLDSSLTQLKIGGMLDSEDKKHNQYLLSVPAAARTDEEELKTAEEKYVQGNEDSAEKLRQQIDDLQNARMVRSARLSEDYIAHWNLRNPQIKAQLDDLGKTTRGSTVRAAEARQELRAKLLAGTPQGRQLRAALAMQHEAQADFRKISEKDVADLRKDRERRDKEIEGHSWFRDAWGSKFGDSSDEASSYTQQQVGKAEQLRSDLASGRMSLPEYARKQDSFNDGYGLESVRLGRKARRSDEKYAAVEKPLRMGASATTAIVVTAVTGNVFVGALAGVAVNQAWDTSNDVYAAWHGRDIYADGHSSLATLSGRAVFDRKNITGEQVAFTFKDDAVDIATEVVTATSVGAAIKTSAALTAKIAFRKGIDLSAGGTLKAGSRALVGAGSGTAGQGVGGAGQVGGEMFHVFLDGESGTKEGARRIKAAMQSALAGMLLAPGTGAISAAIPLDPSKILRPALGAQFLNDAVSSYGTGQLSAQMIDGRWMNTEQIIAASFQTFPGTALNIAAHPMMVARMNQRPGSPPPATPPVNVPRSPPALVNTSTRPSRGLAGRDPDRFDPEAVQGQRAGLDDREGASATTGYAAPGTNGLVRSASRGKPDMLFTRKGNSLLATHPTDPGVKVVVDLPPGLAAGKLGDGKVDLKVRRMSSGSLKGGSRDAEAILVWLLQHYGVSSPLADRIRNVLSAAESLKAMGLNPPPHEWRQQKGHLQLVGHVARAGEPANRGAAVPLVHRRPDINFLQGDVMVDGHAVPARDIEVAVSPDKFLILGDERDAPDARQMAVYMHTRGYRPGQEVVVFSCGAGKRSDTVIPTSLASELSDILGVRVYAPTGGLTLGSKNSLGDGEPFTARPGLPMAGKVHADKNEAARRRFWGDDPDGRGRPVVEPFGEVALKMGALVGNRPIDPFMLGKSGGPRPGPARPTGLGPDGRPLPPSSFLGGRSRDEVVNSNRALFGYGPERPVPGLHYAYKFQRGDHIGGITRWEMLQHHARRLVNRHKRANQPGSKVTADKPSAYEKALFGYLEAPSKDGRTRWAVDELPLDADGSVRTKRDNTFDSFAKARQHAVSRGGGWVNRVEPGVEERTPVSRGRVPYDEVMVSGYYDKDGNMPFAIPNDRSNAWLDFYNAGNPLAERTAAPPSTAGAEHHYNSPRPDYAGPDVRAGWAGWAAFEKNAGKYKPHQQPAGSKKDRDQGEYLRTAPPPDDHAARDIPQRKRIGAFARGKAPAFLGTPKFKGVMYVVAQGPHKVMSADAYKLHDLTERRLVFSSFGAASKAAADLNDSDVRLRWVYRLVDKKTELAEVAATGQFRNDQVDGALGVFRDGLVYPVSVANRNASHAPKPGEVFVDPRLAMPESQKVYTPREKRRLFYKTAGFVVGTGAGVYASVRLGGATLGWSAAGQSLAGYAGARALFVRYGLTPMLYRTTVAGLRESAKIRLQKHLNPGHEDTFVLVRNIANPDTREAALFLLKHQLTGLHARRGGIQGHREYRDAIHVLTGDPTNAAALQTLYKGAMEKYGRKGVGFRGIANGIPKPLREAYAKALHAMQTDPSVASAMLATAPVVVRGSQDAGAIRGFVKGVPRRDRQRYAQAIKTLSTKDGDLNAALYTLQGRGLDEFERKTKGWRGAMRGIRKDERGDIAKAVAILRVNPEDPQSRAELARSPDTLNSPDSPVGRTVGLGNKISYALSHATGGKLYADPFNQPAGTTTGGGAEYWVGNLAGVHYAYANATAMGADVWNWLAARQQARAGKDITATPDRPAGKKDPAPAYPRTDTNHPLVQSLKGLGNRKAIIHAGKKDDGTPMVKPPWIKRFTQTSEGAFAFGGFFWTMGDAIHGAGYLMAGQPELAATSVAKVATDVALMLASWKDYLNAYRDNRGMGRIVYHSGVSDRFNAPLGTAKLNPTKVSDGWIRRGMPPAILLGLAVVGRVAAEEWSLYENAQAEEEERRRLQTPDATTPVPATPPAVVPPADDLPPPPNEELPRPLWVTADGSDPARRSAWAISEAHIETLLTEQGQARANSIGGRDQVVNDALQQFFQINSEYHFRPELMDGRVTTVEGDPDYLREGWKVNVNRF